ncbi:cytochrome P450 CYP749A22-like protein [Tanacetum coccineum]
MVASGCSATPTGDRGGAKVTVSMSFFCDWCHLISDVGSATNMVPVVKDSSSGCGCCLLLCGIGGVSILKGKTSVRGVHRVATVPRRNSRRVRIKLSMPFLPAAYEGREEDATFLTKKVIYDVESRQENGGVVGQSRTSLYSLKGKQKVKESRNFLNWYGPQAELVITDPDIIKEIASNRSVSLARPDLGSYHKKMLGDGLVTSKGEKWARQRKLANHAFSAESLKSMIPAMIESVEMMLLRWKKMSGSEVEMNAEFRILTADVISKTAFGTSYLQGKQVFDMLKEMSSIAGRNYYNPRLLGLGKILKNSDDLKSNKLHKAIQDIIMETIKQREKIMAVDIDAWGTDFLGHLVKATHDSDERYHLSIQDIIDECKTFYVSGNATTSLLLSWAVLLLSIHKEWQEKARNEAFELFGKEHPRSDGIAKLKTIGMIINETLRLYPPGIAIIRKNEREVKLKNLTVPANVNLHIPVLALHHDRKIWGEDAHLFKPERFLEGVSKATKNNPSAYMPFGFGPRNCVGSNFAINTAKVTLAMILQRYRFIPSPSYIHSPVHIVLLIPKNGLQTVSLPFQKCRRHPCGKPFVRILSRSQSEMTNDLNALTLKKAIIGGFGRFLVARRVCGGIDRISGHGAMEIMFFFERLDMEEMWFLCVASDNHDTTSFLSDMKLKKKYGETNRIEQNPNSNITS